MWKTVSIFISSTFRDMHAERDHLENVVFPELKERLRERRCLLEPIDLRVGVETASLAEEQKELEVLKVCLAEIERSRPFLLVLLGDRYGWIPPEARIAAAAQEAGFMIDTRGRSVTALEIEYGILKKHPNQRRRSLFYFREPLPYAQMPPEIAARYSDAHSADTAVRAGFAKLQAFKARVQQDGEFRERVHTYPAAWDAPSQRVTGLADWGNQVRDDLWRELDEETHDFARKWETSWEEQERDAIEEFVEQRAHDFVGREDIAGKLLALARSPAAPDAQWGACVVGESGMGKSALFARLHRQLTTAPSPHHSNTPILLLSHAAGISHQSVQVDSMLLRWTRELAEFLEVPFPLAAQDSTEEIESAFASLLSQASIQRRVVVLIDALNQFEPTPRARYLTWLPTLWPDNARLIATAISGDQSDAPGKRAAIRVEPLSPLSISEAEAIALKVTQRYHRTLNPQVLAAVLSKRLDGDRLAAGNPLWLELALEQLNLLDEDDYTRADREFAGTPEQRLLQMVLHVAADLLPDIEGLYGWMLARTEKVFGVDFSRAFADLIALSRFGWRESDFRVLLPAVAKLLSSEPLSPSVGEGESEGRMRGNLGVEGRCEGSGYDPLRFAQLRRGFRAHMVRRGALAQWDFFHAQTHLAVQRRNLAEPSLVRRIHSAIAGHLQALPPKDPLRQSETMFHLIGADDRPRAARYYGAALDSNAETCGTQVLAAHILDGQDTEANLHLGWVIALPQQPGMTADEVWRVCNRFLFRLNDTLTNEGRLETRLRLLEAARRVLQMLADGHPNEVSLQGDLSDSFGMLGDVQLAKGNIAGAHASLEQSLKIRQTLVNSEPSNARHQRALSISFYRLGNLQHAKGDLAGARVAFEQWQRIVEKLAAGDPSNTELRRDLSLSLDKLGGLHWEQGDWAGARVAYEQSEKIAQKLAAADPSNAQLQRDLSICLGRLGDVQQEHGDLAGARVSLEQARELIQRLTARDPHNLQWLDDLCTVSGELGVVQQEQGDLASARVSFEQNLKILEKLAARDPSNAQQQRSLCVAHRQAGFCSLLAGQKVEAVRQFLMSSQISQRLTKLDSVNKRARQQLRGDGFLLLIAFGSYWSVRLILVLASVCAIVWIPWPQKWFAVIFLLISLTVLALSWITLWLFRHLKSVYSWRNSHEGLRTRSETGL